MPDDDGLPLPNAPYRFPSRPAAAPIPSTPDVPSVSNTLTNTLSAGSAASGGLPSATAATMSALAGIGNTNVPTTAFNPQTTTLDQIGAALAPYVAGPGTTDPSLLSRGIDLFNGTMSYLNNPASTAVTDAWNQAINSQIGQLTADFGGENGTWHQMNVLGFQAQGDLQDLTNLALNPPGISSQIQQLWSQKQTVGDDVLASIASALEQSQPGDEQDQLQSMWQDMSAWQQGRDQRLARESGDVNGLQNTLSGLNDAALNQAGTIGDMSRVVGNLIQPNGVGLCSPTVATAAMAIRAGLMGAKSNIDGVIASGAGSSS